MAVNVYLGLVHYPIYNKNNDIIATAITNFDVHDISRTARTYSLKRYYIIHPLDSQANLVREMIGYWREGFGGEYNPDRKEALSILDIAPDIASVVASITAEEGIAPIIVTTDARKYANTVSYQCLRNLLETGNRPCLVLFGTGYGMEQELMAGFDFILEPIYGPGDYNHLPVRSAVAIILDRLLGEKWWN
ncbi:MAG: hypothetical protein H6Q73_724 [Firmicutes bacterium]|nr:hypothetical protein [Bacillota bacterium]